MLHEVFPTRSLIVRNALHQSSGIEAAIHDVSSAKSLSRGEGGKRTVVEETRMLLAWTGTSLETDVSCMIHCNCQRPRLFVHPWRDRLSGASCNLSNRTMPRSTLFAQPMPASPWWAAHPRGKKSATAIDRRTYPSTHRPITPANKQGGQFSDPNELRLSAYILIDGSPRLRM